MFTKFTQTNLEEEINKNPKSLKIYKKQQFIKKCEFCQKLKFERASHCSICQECISRRDHHCVWIGKCVDFNNLQYFFNFCFWTWLAGVDYIIKFYNFYNNTLFDELFILNKISLFIFTFIITSGTLSITTIIISQLNFIYNDATLLEKSKNHHIENYYFCCMTRDLEKKAVNIYINI